MAKNVPDPSTRIVVGVDGSEESNQALRWAVWLGTALHAPIEAVSAWEFGSVYGLAGPSLAWNPEANAKQVLDDTLDEVFGSQRPADLVLTTVEGQVAHVLRDASKGALMLLVGSRGRGELAALLLGSVSAEVGSHAHCPVLVVHGDSPVPPASI
jgi:nucleotide-binding universal stress UspA family protein